MYKETDFHEFPVLNQNCGESRILVNDRETAAALLKWTTPHNIHLIQSTEQVCIPCAKCISYLFNCGDASSENEKIREKENVEAAKMRAENTAHEARAAEDRAREAAKSAKTAQREFETRQGISEVQL